MINNRTSLLLLAALFTIGTIASVQGQQYKKDTRGVMKNIIDGNLDSAESSAKKIRDRHPDLPEPRFLLALVSAHRENAEKANQRLKQAFERNLPVGQLIAGPRDVLKPLRSLDVYKKAISMYQENNPDAILHGPMVGSALNTAEDTPGIWVRTARAQPVRVAIREKGNADSTRLTTPVYTRSSKDFTAVVPLRNLKPDNTYEYAVYSRKQLPDQPSFNHSFQTFPKQGQSNQFSMVFGGCAGFVPWNERIWDTVAKQDPLAVFLMGDNIYHDRYNYPRIQNYLYYRRHSRPEFRDLVGSTRIFATWDDHDFKNNDSHGGPYRFSPSWKPMVWNIFRNNWANPSYGGGSNKPGLWFDMHIADVHFIWLDTRYYRSNKNGTMLGPVQKRWLKRTLNQSDATFKVIVSSVAFDYRAKNSDDTWNGFKQERTELFKFIRDNKIEGVVLMSSDRHRSDAWLIDEDNGKPEGLYDLYEFNSGRFTNQHKHGTKSSALFSYNKHSFGRVDVNTNADDPTITYTIMNIDGKEIHDLTVKRSQLEFD